jgi:hypothetical protein
MTTSLGRAAFVIVVLAVSAGLGVLAVRLGLSGDAAIVLAIAVVLSLPILYRAASRQFDVFEPIVAFAVAFGVMFVVRPGAVLAHSTLIYARPNGVIDISHTFRLVLIVALIGASAFVAGYSTNIGRRWALTWRPPPNEIDTRTAVTAGVAIAAIGALSFVAFVAFSGGLEFFRALMAGRSLSVQKTIQSGSSYLWTAWQIMIPAGIILYGLGRRTHNRALVLMALGIGAISLVRQLPLGARITLLPLLGGTVILSYLLIHRRPRGITLATVAVIVVVVSATLLTARSADTRDGRSFGGILVHKLADPSEVIVPLTEGGDAEMAQTLAAAFTVIPDQIPYQYGLATVGDLLSRPIPHSVWPGRPLPAREQVIAELWPYEYRINSANPEFSPMLSFYLDFGPIGVFFGLFLYGVVARAVWEYFRANRDALRAQVLLSLSVPLLVIAMRDNFVDSLIRSVWLLGPVFIIFSVARTDSPVRSRSVRTQEMLLARSVSGPAGRQRSFAMQSRHDA